MHITIAQVQTQSLQQMQNKMIFTGIFLEVKIENSYITLKIYILSLKLLTMTVNIGNFVVATLSTISIFSQCTLMR